MENTRSAAIDLLGPGGSIIFDETGQQKYGHDSVGVSIQYLGVIGDTCAAQVGVFASYCVNNISALIDYRLFFPESWINNHKNDEEFGVPVEKLEHKTKPVLALEMLDQFKSDRTYRKKYRARNSIQRIEVIVKVEDPGDSAGKIYEGEWI